MAVKAEPFKFIGSYNNQRISQIDSERSINCFEYIDTRGKNQNSLVGTSGLLNTNLSFSGATGGFRAEYVFNNVHYLVIGSSVFSVTTGGVVSVLGTLLNTTVGYVGIDANTFQIIFVDGVNGYVWDTTALTFTPISDTAFPSAPLDVTVLDGFATVINGGTDQFQLSSFNQFMVWGGGVLGNTFTTNFVTNSNLTLAGTTANYATGTPITFTTTGTLPAPLAVGVTYFAISINTNQIKVATTYANAIAGTFITLTSDGTGVQTVMSTGQVQLGQVTSHPGTLVACRALHRRIFFFSQFFTEVWENAGLGTNLPFRRNNSLLIEYGTPSIGSIAQDFDIMIFQGQTRGGLGAVLMIAGTDALPVSTRALNTQLGAYAALNQLGDCRSFLIKENGLIFYRMNFTAANHTFIYNVSQSQPSTGDDAQKFWHEEEVLNGNRHPTQTHAYFNGKNYGGSYKSPTLYQFDPNMYTNDGEVIRRARIGGPIPNDSGARRRIDRIYLDFIQGQVSLVNNPIANVPFAFLSLSKDGGQSYKYKQKAPLGAIGQRAFRTVWRKLGVIPRGQAVVPMLEFFTPIPFAVTSAFWASEVLPE